MKKYEKPCFEFDELNFEDVILASIIIESNVYPDDSAVKTFD